MALKQRQLCKTLRRCRKHSHGCKLASRLLNLLEKIIDAHSRNPHPIFVIVLVGPAEQPFGIQKDFLCHRSEHYRKYFEAKSSQDTLEHVVKLPESTAEEFGLVQHFLYTGQVIADAANIPSYESLVGLWKLGNKLGIDGLCDQTLDAMKTCKRLSQRIPATPLLVQVWRDTPEGSTIRNLLLSWTAEYMRSSDARADFAKTLPQEVLSELVVAMSSFSNAGAEPEPLESPSSTAAARTQKNIHYLDQGSDDESLSVAKRGRRSSGAPFSSGSLLEPKPTLGRKPSRVSSLAKPQKRRPSAMFADPSTFTTSQKMDFCADLLTRMLSGPGKTSITPLFLY